MKYVLLSKTGYPDAFYDDTYHGARTLDEKPNPKSLIPAAAVPISDEIWNAWLPHTHDMILVDGALKQADIRSERGV